ncbi:cobalt ECF transporter T component CbiQ [Geobacter benzoatilyticus]|uniref:Cobalt ECF transporter T component CbiQ n=1 Tax=Geobacter benzoatilyticus TaxID=2815309 RepID=A0ABX7Q2M3_9BACT|nr:cobalt ECF transporter T component CbiQ [Geobacter benzoatilyticus]QSV45644.1 cobalt ECF transporter T component CbiQ [Geobacter benzoatilyticus]
MAHIETALRDLNRLELLAEGDSAIHRLDPRAKVIVTLFFIVMVVSFGRYEVSGLIPFVLYPVVIVAVSGIPPAVIVRKLLMIIPFAAVVGLFNPIFDREPLMMFGNLEVSGGWISFLSIIIRAALTVGGALALVAVTGFTGVCMALERFGVPRPFVVQLLFLYRYIFVLGDEGVRMARARELRSFAERGMGLQSYAALIGSLLLRTWDRAERIHMAMLSRGFRGAFHVRREYRFGRRELVFTAGWCLLFLLFRYVNLPRLAGALIAEVIS